MMKALLGCGAFFCLCVLFGRYYEKSSIAEPLNSIEGREVVANYAGSKESPSNGRVTDNKPMSSAKSTDSDADEIIRSQLRLVAAHYKHENRFPHYSTLVDRAEYTRRHQPHLHNQVNIPHRLSNNQLAHVNLSLNKQTFFYGDEIEILFSSDQPLLNNKVSVTVKDYKQIAKQLALNANDSVNGASVYTGKYRLPDSSREGPQELLLTASGQVGQDEVSATVRALVTEPSATVVQVLNENPNDEHLEIPIELDVNQPGYYVLSAILSNRKSGEPLLLLHAEKRLENSRDVITLQAHISALKESKSEGPYQLAKIELARRADTGESFDIPGATSQSVFDVQGFSFDRYRDAKYADALLNERAQFLERLAQPSNP